MGIYQGFTREELKERFVYNPKTGEFMNRRKMTVINATNKGRLVLPVRSGDKVINLSRAKVALLIMEDRELAKGENIKYIDGDNNNNAYSNISVVKSEEHANHDNAITYSAVATPCKGVYQVLPTGYYVARRGHIQAVYRTYDYEEAVAIRKEWEKDKTIHKWDRTMPKQYLPT